jgi:segregation and condensation protein A
MSEYQIKLDVFEGPFDLLLHLINVNEVDIYDIPIAEITAQYLAYIEAMEALDLNIASEFLVMAASLLSIKARMLLPKPPPELLPEDEDYDPRAQLVRDLLEYKRIKEAAGKLDKFYKDRQQHFSRDNDIGLYSGLFGEQNPLEGKTVSDLTQAFYQVWQRVKEEQIVHSISRDSISLGLMANRLVDKLRQHPDGILFSDMFLDMHSKLHVVVGFLAILELVKDGVIRVWQDEPYAKIFLLPEDLSAYQYEES